jgi:predicted SPOUT superfamily RNA methylase MTH1
MRRLWVALPDSILMECSTLREKTEKVGIIGRAVAIFGVDRVIIYHDRRDGTKEDAELVSLLLHYMETPPYLRRALFPIRPDLRYAGLLPPLKMVHHKEYVELSELKHNELREGLVIKAGKALQVNIGLRKPLELRDDARPGSRITIKIVRENGQLFCRMAGRDELPRGWGFSISKEASLLSLLKHYRPSLFLATAKEGIPLQLVWKDVFMDVKRADSVLIAFGSPARGLHEILEEEGEKLENVAHYVLNTIPEQCVATVRTEEALLCTLAILNIGVRMPLDTA